MKKLIITLFTLTQASNLLAYTLPSHPLMSYECDNCATLSHETLNYYWTVKDQQYAHIDNNARKSYGYHLQVSAGELSEGVVINTLAPRAILSIRPLGKYPLPSLLFGKAATPLQPLQQMSEVSGMLPESQDQLMVYQLHTKAGKGQFVLKAADQNHSTKDKFLIHVYDKYANTYMTVATDKIRYQANDWVKTTVTLADIDDNYPTTSVKGSLINPQGEMIPIELSKSKKQTWEGRMQLTSETNSQGKNWVVQAQISGWTGDQKVTRTGHTAFSYELPSATFVDIQRDTADDNAITVHVKNATASRYGLQAVLFNKDAQGQYHPLYISQTSSWLEPGTHAMILNFPQSGAF